MNIDDIGHCFLSRLPVRLAQIAQVLGVTKEFLSSGAEDTGGDRSSEIKLNPVSLEAMMKAIEAKRLSVSVRPHLH
jgi:hypothetical protein